MFYSGMDGGRNTPFLDGNFVEFLIVIQCECRLCRSFVRTRLCHLRPNLGMELWGVQDLGGTYLFDNHDGVGGGFLSNAHCVHVSFHAHLVVGPT